MKYLKGDLIKLFKEDRFDVIAHQCNCYSVMGGGIAGKLVQEFPQIEKKNQT